MLFEKYKNCKVFSDKLCDDDITQDVMDIDGHWYTYGTICDKYIFLAFSAFLGTDFHFIRSGVENGKGGDNENCADSSFSFFLFTL